MKHKWLAIALAVCLAMTAFVGCGEHNNDPAAAIDPYGGVMSADTFETVESAAQAFLSEQLDGDPYSDRTVLEAVETIAELTDEELEKLGQVEGAPAGILSGTRVKVTYTDGESTGPQTRTICILRLGSDPEAEAAYCYYASPAEVGERASFAELQKLIPVSDYEISGKTYENGEEDGGLRICVTTSEFYSNEWYYDDDELVELIHHISRIGGRLVGYTYDV